MTVCDQCDEQAAHDPVHVGGTTIPGWVSLCCVHADVLMLAAASTVPQREGRAGWASWQREHRLICGPHELTLVAAS